MGEVRVKYADVKAGDLVTLDDGFTCAVGGVPVEVHANADGALYFRCQRGKHYIEGEMSSGGRDLIVGIVAHTPAKAEV